MNAVVLAAAMSKGQEEIRQLIKMGMLAHRLPRARGRQLYAGHGEGLPCACCGETITPEQVQYDVEWDEEGGSRKVLSMHLPCYDSWRAESAVLATKPT